MYGAAMGFFFCPTSSLFAVNRPCSTQWNSMTRSPPGDVLYDLAFLLMDLEERRLRAAANLLLYRYFLGKRRGASERPRRIAAFPEHPLGHPGESHRRRFVAPQRGRTRPRRGRGKAIF